MQRPSTNDAHPMIDTIVIASGNNGKIREIRAALSAHLITLLTQAQVGVDGADEPHATFLENALAKARHVACVTGKPTLADDSGLVVPALGYTPGVHSARYSDSGSDDDNNLKLLTALSGIDDRRAFYYAIIIFIQSSNDPAPIIGEGCWYGEITRAPRGDGGFGYDPLFFDPHLGKTGAEMTISEKQQVSHRGQSLQQITQRLKQHGLLSSP